MRTAGERPRRWTSALELAAVFAAIIAMACAVLFAWWLALAVFGPDDCDIDGDGSYECETEFPEYDPVPDFRDYPRVPYQD